MIGWHRWVWGLTIAPSRLGLRAGEVAAMRLDDITIQASHCIAATKSLADLLCAIILCPQNSG